MPPRPDPRRRPPPRRQEFDWGRFRQSWLPFAHGVLFSGIVLVAAVLWFFRPGRVDLDDPALLARMPPAASTTTPRIAPPAPVVVSRPVGIRLPAEFEPQEAMILGVNELIQYHPQTLAAITRAVHEKIRIIGLVADEQQAEQTRQLLREQMLPASAIELLKVPVVGMWVRDYGPIFVVTDDGQLQIMDGDYTQRDRPTDNEVPVVLSQLLNVPRIDVPLSFEGGNILSNGQGLCLTTSAMTFWNAHRGYDMPRIGAVLADYFGFKNWAYVQPMLGEPSAHVDMLATFTAPNVVVVAQCDPADDPINAKILDEGAAILAQLQVQGAPITVERLPMPSHRDGHWRTYTNVVYANGVLLVPQYPDMDPQLDARALELYRRLLPDWEVVGIDVSRMIVKRGALHCVCIQMPKVASPTTVGTVR